MLTFRRLNQGWLELCRVYRRDLVAGTSNLILHKLGGLWARRRRCYISFEAPLFWICSFVYVIISRSTNNWSFAAVVYFIKQSKLSVDHFMRAFIYLKYINLYSFCCQNIGVMQYVNSVFFVVHKMSKFKIKTYANSFIRRSLIYFI